MGTSCKDNGIGFCVSGIENAEQDKMLEYAHIDYKQGFYYDYPMQIEDLLETEKGK